MSTEKKYGFISPIKQQSNENPIEDMPSLFEAALTEFSKRSFEGASLNDMIKTSGISKGSFYHKFADKLDLYLCMVDKISREKMSFFARRYESIFLWREDAHFNEVSGW